MILRWLLLRSDQDLTIKSMSFANLFLEAHIFTLIYSSLLEQFNKKKSGHVAVTLVDAVPFVFVCCDVDAQNEGETKIPVRIPSAVCRLLN